MKKFGLIGHPIAHSLSPALFKAAYAGKYTYDLIEEEDFNQAYDRFISEYDAINVTAPFKELAAAKADSRSQECEITGAANILVKNDDSTIEAANSDIMGVIGALSSRKGTEGTSTKALIVGCGGAAMAAAYATCSLGYETVIINRNQEKAKAYAEKLSKEPYFKVSADNLESFCRHFRKSGIIVYTLPVMIPALEMLSKSDLKGGLFCGNSRKTILEANYRNPAFTQEIIDRMQSVNPEISIVNGKEWLLYQAVDAYRIFTREEPDIEAMRNVFE